MVGFPYFLAKRLATEVRHQEPATGMFEYVNLLAQDPPSPLINFLPLALIFALFYFIILRPQVKEKRKREEVLSELKKNDKVLTIGGIIGTIADLSSDGRRVTLKVDDSTRVKIQRSAIQGLYDENAPEPTSRR